ncbi:MAG: PAS domain-containing methyl-accepting chemotaxis protein [Rhizobium sp.]|nr:PAS domain-containing methyl-accepting chemotaxis protein [Rhizobium sp.]
MALNSYLSANRLAEDTAALSHSQAMIWFKPDGTIINANANFCKILRYELKDIVGKHHRIFCDDSFAGSADYERFWSELASGNYQKGQFRRQSKSKQDVWIEASYNPVFRRGKVVRILKIASDITATKIAALHDANRIRAINQSQAIIEFETDGSIVQANENFLKTMGYDADEVVGRHHRMFCDPGYSTSPDYLDFWSRLRRGEFITSTFVRYAKGGNKVWIQAAYTPVFSSRGEVYRVIKVATDITPRMIAVSKIGAAIKRLADGDLTVDISEKLDPVLEDTRLNFNMAARALERMMSSIMESTQTLTLNARVISDISNGIAANGETQAATVEETAAALEEITTTVRDTSARTTETTRLVGVTREDAEASGDVVRQATAAMGEIERSSSEIENIIGVIDEIAFQTNLLALNAGVEAARAGEAGKGFAVVAQEVRELAQRSASAAKDIKGLIAKASQAVRRGVAFVDKTGVALGSIVGQVQEIDSNVDAIATAAREQAIGINEINSSISSLDQTTQRNAATAEEANAAATTLAQEADALYRLISQFRTSDSLGASPSMPARAA